MNIDRKSKIKRSKNLCLICSNSKITHPQKFKQGNKSCNDCLLKHKEKRRQKALLGKCINCRNDKRLVPEKFRGLNKTCDDCLLKNHIRVTKKSNKRTKADLERMLLLKKETEKVVHHVIRIEFSKSNEEDEWEEEKENKRVKKEEIKKEEVKEQKVKEEVMKKEKINGEEVVDFKKRDFKIEDLKSGDYKIGQFMKSEGGGWVGEISPLNSTHLSSISPFKSLNVLSEICYNIACKKKEQNNYNTYNYCSNQEETDSTFEDSLIDEDEDFDQVHLKQRCSRKI
eukprot:TRINITY_DN2043_c0_g1_i2.p1 TRINITY_DN2043_c0_g1~~TRINITY_DN2043_c0_g1_i2.p1  ORF type:complete len:284 (+),score=74.42 TRINITY_DN2043_c0_g1_i2:298-1149(+)